MFDYFVFKEIFFMLVVRFNVVDVVEFFVERGVLLEYEDDMGFIVLYHVVMGGKLENILWLIEFGCNVFKVNYYKFLVIYLVVENGYIEVVCFFLEYGVFVKKVNCFCMIFFMLVLKNGYFEII